MRRLDQCARRTAAFAVVAAAMMAGGEARAGGIIITSGTTQQTGDPTYEYIFTVELLAGSTLLPGGYFTIYDLPGVPPGALTSQPSLSWGSAIQYVGMTPPVIPPPLIQPPDNDTIENVTWQWNGKDSIVAPADSNRPLGTFIVGSTVELPGPPVATLFYVGTLDGTTASNEGTIAINGGVPEPASITLLSTAAVLGLCAYARGRRRVDAVAA